MVVTTQKSCVSASSVPLPVLIQHVVPGLPPYKITPCGQVEVQSPGTFADCLHDTIQVERNPRKGPKATSATILHQRRQEFVPYTSYGILLCRVESTLLIRFSGKKYPKSGRGSSCYRSLKFDTGICEFGERTQQMARPTLLEKYFMCLVDATTGSVWTGSHQNRSPLHT